MKFLHLRCHLFRKEVEFGKIEGYDDIKRARLGQGVVK
jgi:hypothetical protein